MPRLGALKCTIELAPTNLALKEYGTQYGDGFVEAFVAVPNAELNFSVHLTSNGYIAPGVAMFVYIDGRYQGNRNRRGLVIPDDCTTPEMTNFDLRLRQRESKDLNGMFVGRDWSFAKLNIVAADKAPKVNPLVYYNLGTIEVVVLRTKDAAIDIPTPHLSARTVPAPLLASVGRQRMLTTPNATASRAPSKQADSMGGLMGLFDGANDTPDFMLDGNGNDRYRPSQYETYPHAYAEYTAPTVGASTSSPSMTGLLDAQWTRDDRSRVGAGTRPMFRMPNGKVVPQVETLVDGSLAPHPEQLDGLNPQTRFNNYGPPQSQPPEAPFTTFSEPDFQDAGLRQALRAQGIHVPPTEHGSQTARNEHYTSPANYPANHIHSQPEKTFQQHQQAPCHTPRSVQQQGTNRLGIQPPQQQQHTSRPRHSYQPSSSVPLVGLNYFMNQDYAKPLRSSPATLGVQAGAQAHEIPGQDRAQHDQDNRQEQTQTGYKQDRQDVSPQVIDFAMTSPRKSTHGGLDPCPCTYCRRILDYECKGAMSADPHEQGYMGVGNHSPQINGRNNTANRNVSGANNNQQTWGNAGQRDQDKESSSNDWGHVFENGAHNNNGGASGNAAVTAPWGNNGQSGGNNVEKGLNDHINQNSGKPNVTWAQENDQTPWQTNQGWDDDNNVQWTSGDQNQGLAGNNQQSADGGKGKRGTYYTNATRTKANDGGMNMGNQNNNDNNNQQSASKINWGTIQPTRDNQTSGNYGWGNVQPGAQTSDGKDWAQRQVPGNAQAANDGWSAPQQQQVQMSGSPNPPVQAASVSGAAQPHIKPYWADWNKPSPPLYVDASDPNIKKRRNNELRDPYIAPAEPLLQVAHPPDPSTSHQVKIGKAANYAHRASRPEYIDAMEKPYAFFSFKYRSPEALLAMGFKADSEDESAKLAEQVKLWTLSKNQLVKEVLKARASSGEKQASTPSGAIPTTGVESGWNTRSGPVVDAGNNWASAPAPVDHTQFQKSGNEYLTKSNHSSSHPPQRSWAKSQTQDEQAAGNGGWGNTNGSNDATAGTMQW
ncbi:hypothetical protein LTR50_000455 [Elasticomyces elasticus]|nr:hypothetical protein LTR50_000455 [Elasticomyces elasticus]